MDDFSKILGKRLQAHGLSESARATLVLTEAERYLAKLKFPEKTPFTPTTFKKGVLWIAVNHPLWAQEFSFIRPKMLKYFKDHFGEQVIREIRTKNI